MNKQPLYAHRIAAARGKGRFMRAQRPAVMAITRTIGALVLAAVVLTGCAGVQPCTTRTEIQRVPQPVFIRVPGEFVEPLEVQPLPEDLNNRDLEADIRELEDVIDRAQGDRERIRERQKRQAEGEGEP